MNTTTMSAIEIERASERLAERWMFCSSRGLVEEEQALWALFDFFNWHGGNLCLDNLQTLQEDDRKTALELIGEAVRDRDIARLIHKAYERVTDNFGIISQG